MLRAGIIVGVALTFGCTINAPPAEELSGDALKVTDGKLQIDDTRVPVVAECSAGQVVARSADDQAWECVTVQSTTISAGSGSTVTQGEAGDFNVAVAFGDAATEAATGARALALEGRMGLVETGLGEAKTSLGAADTAIDGRLDIAEADIDGLTLSLGAADTAIGGRLDIAEADIDGLTLSLGAAEADIDGLTLSLGAAEADIDDLTPRLGAAEADIDGLTVDLGAAESAIDGRLDTAEAGIAAAKDRLDTLQNRDLIEYASECEPSAVGVFKLEAGILSFCDGEDFRTIEVAPSPPPELVAQFTLASFLRVPSKTWPNLVPSGPEMFIGSKVVVGSLNNGTPDGVIHSPAGSSPLAHMILELPVRKFSIEIVANANGNGLLFTHAPDGLSFSAFGVCEGCERVITESGVSVRFITPSVVASTDPTSIRHFLYVHDADDQRILYENGVKTLAAPNQVNAPWPGPYLGGRGIFSLGGNATNVGFNPINNNVVFFEASVFNTALNAAEALSECQSAAAESGFDVFCQQ